MNATVDLATILLLGAVQAAFLVVLIAGKKRKSLPDAVLAAWVCVLGLHHLFHAFFLEGVRLPSAVLNLNAGVPLLQGPFLFLYVDTLTSGRRALRWSDALHLLPFVGFAAFVTFVLPFQSDAGGGSISVFRVSSLLTLAIVVSVPAYAVVALRRLRRHEALTLERHSERRGRDLSWLRRIVYALLAVWAVVIGVAIWTLFDPSSLPTGLRHQIMTAVTLFIYAIGYFGWRQFAVVEPDDQPTDEGTAPKYERSGLEEAEIRSLVERLESHLDRDRPYLEPGLTLKEIAASLDTTPNHLSQAINQGLGKNFYEVINQRRVDAFSRLVLEPENRHRNLLAIAFDSGFSSKSSFNRVFKQLTGVSPRQYLEGRKR